MYTFLLYFGLNTSFRGGHEKNAHVHLFQIWLRYVILWGT